jgi:DNA polymerase-3 subunit beta
MTTDFATVGSAALRRALKPMSDIVRGAGHIPILECVKISVASSVVSIEATDLDISAFAKIDAVAASGDWSLCLNARILSRIASVAGAMDVRIRPAEDNMAIVELGDGDAKYSLHSIDAGDFPAAVEYDCTECHLFKVGELAKNLRKVSKYISTEETRYYLNGVYWSGDESGQKFVATDGHRLGLCYFSEDAKSEQFGHIIPRRSVHIIARHAPKTGTVRAGNFKDDKGDYRLIFRHDEITFVTKTINGTFPDYKRIIPKNREAVIEFSRAELVEAISRVCALGAKYRAVKFSQRGEAVILSLKNDDDGASECRVPARANGRLEDFGLNGAYLASIIESTSGDKIFIATTGKSSPVIVEDGDKSMTRVIMPMMV